jgi:hypothetical protein
LMREPLNPFASVKVFHLLRSLHVSTSAFEKLSRPIRFQTHVLYLLQTLGIRSTEHQGLYEIFLDSENYFL